MSEISGSVILLAFVVVLLVFFLTAWFVQILYNYSAPRVVESVSPSYNKNNFRKINYTTAMAVLLLCSMLFGSTVVVQKYI